MTEEKFRILVADDEESLRGILKEVLTDSGYEVECVEDGDKALEKVRGDKKFRVVITDIRMPGLNGIELLEQIKEHDKSIEVVIMTSHGSLDTAIKAIRLGAYDYLTKPFEDLDIITTVVNRTVEKLRLEIQVQKLLEELKARKEDVEALYDCTAELATTLDLSEILSQSTNHLTRLGRCKVAIYFHNEAETQTLKGQKASGWKDGKLEDLSFELKGAKVVANYFKVIDNDTELKKRMGFTQQPQHTLLLPLKIGDNVKGVYAVLGKRDWTSSSRALLTQFVGDVGIHLEKGELHDQVKELAIRDGLTGLFNHRYFQNSLQQEVERARRFKSKLSLLFFDIDHFKKYNDTNGHPMGDSLLREIGKMINSTLRKIDVAARYGGEEFAIITMETDKKGAQILAERIRKMIAEYPFQNREAQPGKIVSVSIGVAEFPKDGDTNSSLIEAADKALYQAKESGRNRVVLVKN